MKNFKRNMFALLYLLPTLSFADNVALRADEMRLALQYYGAAYIQAGRLLPNHENLLPTDLVAQIKQLSATSLTLPINAINTNIKLNTQEYNDLKNIVFKDGIYYPHTVQEVQQLVNYARTNKLHIRTIGAAHSPQPSIYDANNKNQILVILAGDLRKIDSITPDASKDFAIVTVGAGCNLGVNTADPESNWQNSFDYQVDQAGYALPTLGGISHQTIAGFLQTSSSGGSSKHNIADAIEAIEWVDGNGVLHHANKGEDEFNAAVVSMGMFGIVTHVTFKLPKRYLVEGVETNHELADSVLAQDANGHFTRLHDALFASHEYIHINWLPQKYVDRTMEWMGDSTDANLPIKPYVHTLSSKAISHMATVVFHAGNLIDEFSSTNDAMMKTKASMLKLFSTPGDKQEFRDVWYKTLPIDDQADVDGEIKTAFSEMWFPEDQLDNVMQRLQELFKTNPKAAGNFIVELYCAKQSPFWMSPSYGHNVFRLDLYFWHGNLGDPKKYFGIFWEKLADVPGARWHWGKYIPLPGEKYGAKTFSAENIYRNYPKYNDWLKLRAEMDPQQIFVTDYWRKLLAIPQA